MFHLSSLLQIQSQANFNKAEHDIPHQPDMFLIFSKRSSSFSFQQWHNSAVYGTGWGYFLFHFLFLFVQIYIFVISWSWSLFYSFKVSVQQYMSCSTDTRKQYASLYHKHTDADSVQKFHITYCKCMLTTQLPLAVSITSSHLDSDNRQVHQFSLSGSMTTNQHFNSIIFHKI